MQELLEHYLRLHCQQGFHENHRNRSPELHKQNSREEKTPLAMKESLPGWWYRPYGGLAGGQQRRRRTPSGGLAGLINCGSGGAEITEGSDGAAHTANSEAGVS